MPPQPKKTRILTSTSRQNIRPSRKQVERSEDEEEEPSDENDPIEPEVEDESQEPGTSPSKTNARISEIMENLVDTKRASRKTRKQDVLDSYSNTYTTTQNSIATLFDEHETQSDAAHRTQLKVLAELIAKKAKIEAAMTEKLNNLRASYDMRSRDLEAALTVKIAQLK